tara:strand:+ start:5795 stop:6058 length:264 start_codon:yes stop_codon:yes gene_type:complete
MRPKPETIYRYTDGKMKSEFVQTEKDGEPIEARFVVAGEGKEYWETRTGLKWEESPVCDALRKEKKGKKGGEEKVITGNVDLNTPSY